jgi:arylsulfatase A-like enzyme
MVNSADPGRLIQQSYYAGKRLDRKADGQSKSWSPWTWNPIQGGGVSSWARVNDFKRLDALWGKYSAEHAELTSTWMRVGDWKLIRFYALNDDRTDLLELYNLKDDLSETKNLAAQMPAKAVFARRVSVPAAPTHNLSATPAATRSRSRFVPLSPYRVLSC